MKFNYKFSNLIGTVYRKGDIIFSANGDTVICPVGNKISCYDLKNNVSKTLSVEARNNYNSLCLSPNGKILIASVDDGELQIINLTYRNILYRKHFNKPVTSIKISPNGKYFAFAKDSCVFVYGIPRLSKTTYNPFELKRTYTASDDVTCIDWSDDSRVLAFGSRDMSIHVVAFTKFENLRKCPVAGNTDTVIGVYFEENSLNFCSVNRRGVAELWESSFDKDALILAKDPYEKRNEEEEDDYFEIPTEIEENPIKKKKLTNESKPKEKMLYYKRKLMLHLTDHLENKNIFLTSNAYYKKSSILVAAFSSGDFLMMDMSDAGFLIHSLNVSNQKISSCSLNSTGDWLALGMESGQLGVWEWQSETFILKQQSHFNNVKVVAYSPDGSNIATGGEDGKVKLWSVSSSFHFHTFDEHKDVITGITFTQSGKAIVSSSLDGTVRAFDKIRYRNFKTLTSPKPAQFSCLTVDSSGELVAAGGKDDSDIYLWSLQTGRLLEILSGHSSPVTSLQFSTQPGSTMLVSTAWDKTLKVWDAVAATTAKETISLMSDGLCVCLRPDGKQVAVSTIDGHITFFNAITTKQEGMIEGREDLGAGRADSDKITAKSNLKSKYFATLSYSTDGKSLLAAGQSKRVCIYNVESELLIKKFEITQNRAFDAMDEIIDRRKMAEHNENLALIEERGGDDGGDVRIKLPGTRSGDMSLRAFRPEIRVSSLTFSPTGRSWAACSSEGVLIYSLDDEWLFDPLLLEQANTPSATKKKLQQKQYSTALMMACQLNIKILIQEVMESIPLDSISVVISTLPLLYVESVIKYLGGFLETSRHVGLYARWISIILVNHGKSIKNRSPALLAILNDLQKALSLHFNNLGKVCSHNEHTLNFLLSQASLKERKEFKTEEESDDLDSMFDDNEIIE